MRKRSNKNNKKGTCIGFIIVVAAIVTGVIGFLKYRQEKEEDLEALAVYSEIKEITLSIDTETNENNLIINWDKLKEYNVVGWIRAGNDISFPIMQSNDNSYYLYRLYNGTYNANGSIFMDCECNSDFSDLNTIIYGHRMRGGAMFGPLYDLLDYKEENIKEFEIYLPDGTKHLYDIYSVTKVKADGYAYTNKFGSLESFTEYKYHLKEESQYDTGVETTDAKTVLLSTCDVGSSYGNRIVILGQEKKITQVQEAADWYKKKNTIEINSKKATCIKNNDSYYILYNDIAIRCLKDNIESIFYDSEKTIIILIEYIDTNEYLNHEEINGNITKYKIYDIYNYDIK